MDPKEDKIKTKSLSKLRCIMIKLLKTNKEKVLGATREKQHVFCGTAIPRQQMAPGDHGGCGVTQHFQAGGREEERSCQL